MLKNLAIRNFIAYTILAVLLIVLCFVNFAIPATTSRFVGFVPAITTDIDIGGGYASKYSITYGDGVVDKNKELNSTVEMLSKKMSDFGYFGAQVSVGSNDNVYVELPKIKQAQSILNAIGMTGALYITTDSSVDSIDKTKAIVGQDVVDVNSHFSQTTASSFSWGVNIQLTPAGEDKLESLTESASGTLYIYVGEETITQISITSKISTLYFYGTSTTQDNANVTSLAILMGKYAVDFDMVNNEIIETAPAMGESISTWIYVALAIISVIFLAMILIMFGEFVLPTLLSYAFFLTIIAFFMQAIPVFVLSFSGIVALGVGIVMFFASNYIILRSAKRGYAEGKKIPLAVKVGLNANVLKIVDISVITIIIGVACFFIGGAFTQSFAITLALCGAVNMLTSLALNKLFTKWYTTINSKNAKKIHFKREEHVNELD